MTCILKLRNSGKVTYDQIGINADGTAGGVLVAAGAPLAPGEARDFAVRLQRVGASAGEVSFIVRNAWIVRP